ncbi:acetyl-coenzyme A transporter 1-like [Ylistrum balloti]|uniref:acetyl-coenzyme A transporter 1-like n=1 Tax=Ylistrum balloti TaxID=509963 RepID=UPI0029058435|nr:acetyl-coenzyme A transporter 1-like [Ylistrum balloti]
MASKGTKDNGGRKRHVGQHRLVDVTDPEPEFSAPHIPLHTTITQPDLEDMNTDKGKDQGLKGDYSNIALLMLLYILQGIPLGLGGSIPMLLQTQNVSYKEQAIFSFVFWPFSIKLLWAPLVDSLYFAWFGRRKTWLVPIQYLIGLFMFVLSLNIDDLMGKNGGVVNIYTLTSIFFMLNFLAATQDIAVDGWALTMLSRRNVGWASTCNTVGQTAGYFLGNVLFMALESAHFCNTYLRSVPSDKGIVTLSYFLRIWGIVFVVTTTLVWVLKREAEDPEADLDQGVIGTYKQLLNVIRLPSVISYAVIILTAKIGFSVADSATTLKLIEAGMKKETLALFAVPMIPIQIILPLIISKFTSGPSPMTVFLKAMPVRLLFGLWYAFLVWLAYHIQETPGEFPVYFYLLLLGSYALHQVSLYSMFVAQMAFHAKISDPAIGGTYMTLLNTLANLGGNWPGTVALWMIDGLTWKECQGSSGNCGSPSESEACAAEGGSCVTTIDGYYIESISCVVIGFLWLLWRRRKLLQLDSLPESSWKCS